jgi:hypothetical protein
MRYGNLKCTLSVYCIPQNQKINIPMKYLERNGEDRKKDAPTTTVSEFAIQRKAS